MIVIDKTPRTEEEKQELFDEVFIREVEGHEEEFKREMEGVHTVVVPEDMAKQLEALGIPIDFIVSQLLKKAGKVN